MRRKGRLGCQGRLETPGSRKRWLRYWDADEFLTAEWDGSQGVWGKYRFEHVVVVGPDGSAPAGLICSVVMSEAP